MNVHYEHTVGCKQMKDLRERCIWLQQYLAVELDQDKKFKAIESFAREIRNEALEEVEHWVAEEIRKFKDTAALAAGVPEEKA